MTPVTDTIRNGTWCAAGRSHRLRAVLRVVVLICGVLVAVRAPAASASLYPNWTSGVRAVLPADALTNQNPVFNSLSCASGGNCTAVGTYHDSSAHRQGLLLSRSSNTWSAGIKAPLPADAATTPSVFVNTVSCASAVSCAAVGSYQDSSGYSQGLLLSESSGAWTAIKAPLPADAASNPDVSLNSVSCRAAGSCTAVGSYKNASGLQGLMLSESSRSWTASTATPPTDAGKNPLLYLSSVSCASADNCVAIGSYHDRLAEAQTLLVSESSGAWSAAIRAPLPPDGGATGGHNLDSVSCPAAGNCGATGYYYDSSRHAQGLLLSESSGTWTATKASLPANAGADPSPQVVSVSCAAAGECTAGGYYTDASGHSQGVLLSESSGAWSAAIKAPLPADAGTNPRAELASVSCASAGTCSAVGFYADSSGNGQGLVLSEAAGTWATPVKASVPGDAATNPDAGLGSISCVSAGSCSAVGDYRDSSTYYPGLLVSAIPANPTVTVSAPTTGTVGRTLDPSTVAAALSMGASPTGTISFRVFGPQFSPPASCASGATIVGSASVSGNGTYHPSAGFTPTSAGSYWWYASYSGDASDNPADSACGAGMAKTVVPALGGGGGGSPRVKLIGVPHTAGTRLKFKLQCLAPAGQSCLSTNALTTTETLKHGKVIALAAAQGNRNRRKRTILVGRTRVTIPAQSTKTITIALNTHGRKLLARFHKLPVALTVALISNSKPKVAIERTLTIRPKTEQERSR
jgi:hypothetical protein